MIDEYNEAYMSGEYKGHTYNVLTSESALFLTENQYDMFNSSEDYDKAIYNLIEESYAIIKEYGFDKDDLIEAVINFDYTTYGTYNDLCDLIMDKSAIELVLWDTGNIGLIAYGTRGVVRSLEFLNVINERDNKLENMKVVIENEIDDIKKKLESAVYKYCQDTYDEYADEFYNDYFKVEVNQNNEDEIMCYVHGELGFDEFMILIDEYLDPVVKTINSNSYFEMEAPGIAFCLIWGL